MYGTICCMRLRFLKDLNFDILPPVVVGTRAVFRSDLESANDKCNSETAQFTKMRNKIMPNLRYRKIRRYGELVIRVG